MILTPSRGLLLKTFVDCTNEGQKNSKSKKNLLSSRNPHYCFDSIVSGSIDLLALAEGGAELFEFIC